MRRARSLAVRRLLAAPGARRLRVARPRRAPRVTGTLTGDAGRSRGAARGGRSGPRPPGVATSRGPTKGLTFYAYDTLAFCTGRRALDPASSSITGAGQRPGRRRLRHLHEVHRERHLDRLRRRARHDQGHALRGRRARLRSARCGAGRPTTPCGGAPTPERRRRRCLTASARPSRHVGRRWSLGYCAVVPTLVLLRHGESIWNEQNLFTGWEDVGLTERGEREAVGAEACSRDEPGLDLRVLHTSLLTRAIRTAELALGRGRSQLAAGPAQLAAERAPLRRPHGSQQEGDRRALRQSAAPRVAPQLRRPAAAHAGRRPTPRRRRPPLPRRAPRPAAFDGVPEGRRRTRAPLLRRRRRPRPL